MRRYFYIPILLAATSCSSGPRAQPLDLPYYALESAIEEAGSDPLIQHVDVLTEDWWNLFNDPQLTCFVETAFLRNPTLQSAKANILLASYNADRVRASLFPYIYWAGDISRQKLSQTGIIPFNTMPNPTSVVQSPPAQGGAAGIPVYFTQYESEFIFSYDFDLWGKNCNTWRAAIGEVKANIAEEAFTRLQLGIAVARSYYDLQIAYRRQEIAQQIVENRTEYVELVQKRVSGNVDNKISSNSAESSLATARQQLAQVKGDVAVYEHQLKTYLAGDFEESIENIKIEEEPLPKVPLPRDLPLHLIAHRPDIMAQLWTIESAGRQIEVAKAGFYPDFNISGFIGLQTIHLHEFFQKKSSYFNVDPAFSLPIFDAGRLEANLRGSEVNYDAAIFQYNEMILNAVREVLDGLTLLRSADQQYQQLKIKSDYQEENYKLTGLRRTHNVASSLDYLDSEEAALVARDQEIMALGNTIQAILFLIKSVGGGYDTCDY